MLMVTSLMWASLAIVTFSDTQLAEKVSITSRSYDRNRRLSYERPTSVTWSASQRLEPLEVSLMLASDALVLVCVPINRVLKCIRQSRSQRYTLLRGFYRGIRASEPAPETRLEGGDVVVLLGLPAAVSADENACYRNEKARCGGLAGTTGRL